MSLKSICLHFIKHIFFILHFLGLVSYLTDDKNMCHSSPLLCETGSTDGRLTQVPL